MEGSDARVSGRFLGVADTLYPAEEQGLDDASPTAAGRAPPPTPLTPLPAANVSFQAAGNEGGVGGEVADNGVPAAPASEVDEATLSVDRTHPVDDSGHGAEAGGEEDAGGFGTDEEEANLRDEVADAEATARAYAQARQYSAAAASVGRVVQRLRRFVAAEDALAPERGGAGAPRWAKSAASACLQRLAMCAQAGGHTEEALRLLREAEGHCPAQGSLLNNIVACLKETHPPRLQELLAAAKRAVLVLEKDECSDSRDSLAQTGGSATGPSPKDAQLCLAYYHYCTTLDTCLRAQAGRVFAGTASAADEATLRDRVCSVTLAYQDSLEFLRHCYGDESPADASGDAAGSGGMRRAFETECWRWSHWLRSVVLPFPTEAAAAAALPPQGEAGGGRDSSGGGGGGDHVWVSQVLYARSYDAAPESAPPPPCLSLVRRVAAREAATDAEAATPCLASVLASCYPQAVLLPHTEAEVEAEAETGEERGAPANQPPSNPPTSPVSPAASSRTGSPAEAHREGRDDDYTAVTHAGGAGVYTPPRPQQQQPPPHHLQQPSSPVVEAEPFESEAVAYSQQQHQQIVQQHPQQHSLQQHVQAHVQDKEVRRYSALPESVLRPSDTRVHAAASSPPASASALSSPRALPGGGGGGGSGGDLGSPSPPLSPRSYSPSLSPSRRHSLRQPRRVYDSAPPPGARLTQPPPQLQPQPRQASSAAAAAPYRPLSDLLSRSLASVAATSAAASTTPLRPVSPWATPAHSTAESHPSAPSVLRSTQGVASVPVAAQPTSYGGDGGRGRGVQRPGFDIDVLWGRDGSYETEGSEEFGWWDPRCVAIT